MIMNNTHEPLFGIVKRDRLGFGVIGEAVAQIRIVDRVAAGAIIMKLAVAGKADKFRVVAGGAHPTDVEK